MKRVNNRGFLLAESLVVSTFVLTILILLFIQFRNLIVNYKSTYNYNTVESIYDLGSMADYLEHAKINLQEALEKSSNGQYIIIYNNGSCDVNLGFTDSFCTNLANKMNAKLIMYTYSDIENHIQKYINENTDTTLTQSMRDFIKKVEANEVENKGRLIAEFENGTFSTIALNALNESKLNNIYVSKYGDDTWDGSIDKPYKTLQKAYEKSSYSGTTIYIMTDLTLDTTTNMSSDKFITIESLNGTHSIIRGNSLTDNMINQTNGGLTLKNIIVDGNNVASSKVMLKLWGDATIEEGTTIQNANNSTSTSDNTNDGAINSTGNLIINGGTITNNYGLSCGGIFSHSGGSLIINGGTISNNSGGLYGGIYSDGSLTINGGTVNDNSVSDSNNKAYANIYLHSETEVTDSKSSFSFIGNKYYYIDWYGVISGLAFNDDSIVIMHTHDKDKYIWTPIIRKIEDGVAEYYFKIKNSNKYLQVKDNSTTSEASIEINDFDDNTGEKWYLTKTEDNNYYFKNSGGLCLYTNAKYDGTKVQGYTCDNTNTQKWRFTEAS